MQEKMLWIVLGALLCSCERQGGDAEAVLPVYTVQTAHPVVADVPVYRTWIGRLNAVPHPRLSSNVWSDTDTASSGIRITSI